MKSIFLTLFIAGTLALGSEEVFSQNVQQPTEKTQKTKKEISINDTTSIVDVFKDYYGLIVSSNVLTLEGFRDNQRLILFFEEDSDNYQVGKLVAINLVAKGYSSDMTFTEDSVNLGEGVKEFKGINAGDSKAVVIKKLYSLTQPL